MTVSFELHEAQPSSNVGFYQMQIFVPLTANDLSSVDLNLRQLCCIHCLCNDLCARNTRKVRLDPEAETLQAEQDLCSIKGRPGKAGLYSTFQLRGNSNFI